MNGLTENERRAVIRAKDRLSTLSDDELQRGLLQIKAELTKPRTTTEQRTLFILESLTLEVMGQRAALEFASA